MERRRVIDFVLISSASPPKRNFKPNGF